MEKDAIDREADRLSELFGPASDRNFAVLNDPKMRRMFGKIALRMQVDVYAPVCDCE